MLPWNIWKSGDVIGPTKAEAFPGSRCVKLPLNSSKKQNVGRCNRSNEGRGTLDVPGAKCCLGTFLSVLDVLDS